MEKERRMEKRNKRQKDDGEGFQSTNFGIT